VPFAEALDGGDSALRRCLAFPRADDDEYYFKPSERSDLGSA
jgi:hypothetical protein